MSKASRRPSQKAIKALRKERKKAQQELRQRQKAQGLCAPPSSTLSNGKSPYQTVEEERSARVDATGQQLKIYRALLPILLKRLSKIPDLRQPRKVRHKLTVLMIYGILCFAFQMTSRREANRKMTLPQFEANLRLLFPDLDQLPHNDTLGRLLSRIDVTEIEQAHLDMLEHLIRNKKFKRFLIARCYPIAIDGSQKFVRDELWDAECLERKVPSKKDEDKEQGQEQAPEPAKQYYVNVLESCLAFQNGMVIPLLSEVLSFKQGDSQRDKQDCEQRAFKRLAQRLKKRFSHLPIMVLLDGLYANGPVMEFCRQNNWDFMIVLKDDSLPKIWEEINGLKGLQSENRFNHKWGNRRQKFQWVKEIDYDYADPLTGKKKTLKLHAVICEESWEEIAPGSTQVVVKTARHAWLSDQPLNRSNVHERCNLGARHRWGIEVGFLVEKHQGYQYEHCFSYDWQTMRGYHYLMRLGHALNVLARYSYALAKHIRHHGVRGVIAFVRDTLAGWWFSAQELARIATEPCQIRLE
jgi:hypothetical protein